MKSTILYKFLLNSSSAGYNSDYSRMLLIAFLVIVLSYLSLGELSQIQIVNF